MAFTGFTIYQWKEKIMRRKESLYAVIGGVVGAVLTLALCSVMPIGAQNGDATFGEILCTGLKVVSEGKEMIKLGADDDGGSIWVLGEHGSVRVGLSGNGGSVTVYGGQYPMGVGGIFSVSKDGGLVEVLGTKSDTVTGKVRISVNEYGGLIRVRGKEQKGWAGIDVDDSGGRFAAYNRENSPGAMMNIGDNGGRVRVWGEGERSGIAEIKIGEYGGRFEVFGRGDRTTRVGIGVNEYGNGAVSTWDKNGYRLATLK